MKIIYHYLFPLVWFTYVAYWWAKSADRKKTEQIESLLSRGIRLISMVAAIVLLAFQDISLGILDRQLLPFAGIDFWAGAGMTICGLTFSVWARHCLGRNFSQAVTIKKDHELITNGPYAFVRHPIYSGLLLALTGSAIGLDKWRGAFAVILVFSALWYKLRIEEQWMLAHFGKAYEEYARRHAALVPYFL